MRPLVWMTAVGVGSGVVAARLLPWPSEVLYGMAGPLVAAGASWIAYERVHRAAPEGLTRVMITALMLKMLFFGVYVVALVRGVGLRPEPFVACLAIYVVGLHGMEAWFLRRLLTGGGSGAGVGRP